MMAVAACDLIEAYISFTIGVCIRLDINENTKP